MSTYIQNPTNNNQRIYQLDVFRGFAIFGIFMVNILVMNSQFHYRMEWENLQNESLLNAGALRLLELLFYSKFYPIFSFLFGIGIALQLKKLHSDSVHNYAFFIRRFGALFIFGILHISLLWSGDILHLYALNGLALLLFIRLKPSMLLLSAALIFLFPFYSQIFESIVSYCGFDYKTHITSITHPEMIELKRNGSFISGIALRFKEWMYATPLLFPMIGPISFSMLLLGAWMIKKNIFANLTQFLGNIKRPLLILNFILIPYRYLLTLWLYDALGLQWGTPLSIFLYTLFLFSDLCISALYLWTIASIIQKGYLKKLFNSISMIGRMAFTNYILQSLLGYIIFRSFGMYERLNAFQCILTVIAIYSVQILLSKWWLSKFKFGPLEWLWRSISYRKFFPFRLN